MYHGTQGGIKSRIKMKKQLKIVLKKGEDWDLKYDTGALTGKEEMEYLRYLIKDLKKRVVDLYHGSKTKG